MIHHMEAESSYRDEETPKGPKRIYIVTTKVTLDDGDTFELPTVWSDRELKKSKSVEDQARLIYALLENTIEAISDMAEFRAQGKLFT